MTTRKKPAKPLPWKERIDLSASVAASLLAGKADDGLLWCELRKAIRDVAERLIPAEKASAR